MFEADHDWRSYLSALVCTACGRQHEVDAFQGTCAECGKVLFAQYDLAALRSAMPRPAFAGRRWDLWRYRELLPVRAARHAVSRGEGATPVLTLPAHVAATLGLGRGELLVKDEGRNPTGSFKARGLSVAVARAVELGARHIALPSAGNAGAAAAAYAAAHGLGCHVAMPADAPLISQEQAAIYGAELILIEGLVDQAGKIIRGRAQSEGWTDLSTLREPYRVEGKKTMLIELAEAGGWGDAWCPDVVIFPTGGGTGIVGVWKALAELAELGWIGARRPRLVVVQASGCAPLVRAFENGEETTEPWPNAHTLAAGMRVPGTIGDYLILRALRESAGTAVAVSDAEIIAAQDMLARQSGVFAAAEGASTVAALAPLRQSGFLDGDERVVLFNTASGLTGLGG